MFSIGRFVCIAAFGARCVDRIVAIAEPLSWAFLTSCYPFHQHLTKESSIKRRLKVPWSGPLLKLRMGLSKSSRPRATGMKEAVTAISSAISYKPALTQTEWQHGDGRGRAFTSCLWPGLKKYRFVFKIL